MSFLLSLWVVMGILVAWTTIEGVRHGVVRRVVELVGLVLVFLFASTLSAALEPILHDKVGVDGRVGYFTSWTVVIVGGVLLVRLIAVAAQKLIRLTIAGWLDRVGGGVLGAAFGALLVSCVLILVTALPIDDDVKDRIREEPVSSVLHNLAPSIYDAAQSLSGGEGFFEQIRDRVEPAARSAATKIEAVVDEVSRESRDAQ